MEMLAAILYREGKIRATNTAFIFWDLLYPLFYLLVFGVGVNAGLGSPPLGQNVNYNSFFLAGVLGIASFGIAANSSWSFFLDRDNGIFFEMLTYPMRRSEYLLGKMLFNVSIGVVQAVITLAIGCALLKIHLEWRMLPLLAATVIVGTAAWFSFYSIFALNIRRNDLFNSVTSIFYFVFLFASSMFYPLDPLPKWFRIAAFANPITWEVDLFRYSSIGLGVPRTVAIEGCAFLLFAVVSYAFAVRSLREQG